MVLINLLTFFPKNGCNRDVDMDVLVALESQLTFKLVIPYRPTTVRLMLVTGIPPIVDSPLTSFPVFSSLVQF